MLMLHDDDLFTTKNFLGNKVINILCLWLWTASYYVQINNMSLWLHCNDVIDGVHDQITL